MTSSNLDKKVTEAVEYIKNISGFKPEIGMILGSGLGSLVDEFENSVSIKFSDIPNFPVSTVKGHRGEMVLGEYCSKNVVALSGRVHYYEGYSIQEVTFPLRVMAGLGISKLLVTNAGGGINDNYSVGDIVIIKDHINMMGANPLSGTSNFIDLTDAYSSDLRAKAVRAASEAGLELKEGVYLANSGPSYETPAEIKMARILGADIAGMSTVPEVIVANSLGLEVLGMSMITNMAAGMTGEALSHAEVMETTTTARESFKTVVQRMLTVI